MKDVLKSLRDSDHAVGAVVLDGQHRVALRDAPEWLDATLLTAIGRRVAAILTATGGVVPSATDLVLVFDSGSVVVTRLGDSVILVIGDRDLDSSAVRLAAAGCAERLATEDIDRLAERRSRTGTPTRPPDPAAPPPPPPKAKKRRRLGVWS